MRKCMPSGISALPGTSWVRGPAVKIKPLAHPGMNTRAESFGTGLFSWASSGPLNRATATMTTAVVLMQNSTLIVPLLIARIQASSLQTVLKTITSCLFLRIADQMLEVLIVLRTYVFEQIL